MEVLSDVEEIRHLVTSKPIQNPLMKKLILSLFMAVSANALHAQSICFDPNDDVRYDAGDGPNAVAVADFNEDQHKDGVAANYLEGSVSIFIGNGDGTFQPQLVIGGFNGSAEDVKVGDFNNDQHDDILVCLRGTGDNLTFIPGNGDGTFNVPPRLPCTSKSKVCYAGRCKWRWI